MTYGSNTFVAVGWYGSGTIYTSPDGASWTPRFSGTPNNLDAVTWGSNTFVTVGLGGTILTSPDGASWTPRFSGTSNHLGGVTWGSNTFVAVGLGGTILTSPEGASWTLRFSGTSNNLYEVTWGSNTFFAVGEGGTILTSPDGVTWTPRFSGTSNNLYGVTWGSNTFLVVGEGGTILTTPDGMTWTRGPSIGLGAVAYGNNTFVTVGGPIVMTSPDGVTWTERPALTNIGRVYGITYGNNTFVVVGVGGLIFQSFLTGFDDIPGDHWARDYIMALYDSGITGGCSTSPPIFCPDNNLTRAQMAVFVETSLGVPLSSLPGCSETVFNDVNVTTVGDVVCRFIEDFAARGITGGCGNGNYCPNDPVTRQQMATFLEAALQRIPGQLPPTCSGTFSDVTATSERDQFACRIIEDFAAQGITGGCGPGSFCPNAPVTRAQMAVFLVAAPPPLSP